MVLSRAVSGIAPLLLGVLGGCTHHLEASDLAAAPVWYRADTTSILRNFGQPIRRIREDHGSLGSLTMWYYPHLALAFQGGAWCDQIRLLDSTLSTPRGIRVGDVVGAVLKAYGRPAARTRNGDSLWVSYDGPRTWQALSFLAVHDTVRAITMGQRAFLFL